MINDLDMILHGLSSTLILTFDFGIVPTMWDMLVFHFITGVVLYIHYRCSPLHSLQV